MILTSTQDQLVRLAYGELPLLERLETEFALEQDFFLREDYQELRRAKQELPRVTFRPSKSSINAILSYSKHGEMNV